MYILLYEESLSGSHCWKAYDTNIIGEAWRRYFVDKQYYDDIFLFRTLCITATALDNTVRISTPYHDRKNCQCRVYDILREYDPYFTGEAEWTYEQFGHYYDTLPSRIVESGVSIAPPHMTYFSMRHVLTNEENEFVTIKGAFGPVYATSIDLSFRELANNGKINHWTEIRSTHVSQIYHPPLL